GIQRKQDALIADIYSGKISWGEFNAAMDRLNREFEQAVSNFSQLTPTPSAAAAAETKSAKVSEPYQNTPAPSASNKPDANKFDQTAFQAGIAKAQASCAALYADHALDPLRGKLPLGQETTPFAMFAIPEKLRPQDRPVLDL